ncbi:hypothetical protein HY633_04630 [Candidatus Uhrbacteria bacterium]|nr:hypothetical protein [Candidatus Uhrbacteria bacterium]
MIKLFSLESRLWAANIINVVAMFTGLLKVIEVHSGASVSVLMYGMFAFIQITFAEMAWKNRSYTTFGGMMICFCVSLTIMVLACLWP